VPAFQIGDVVQLKSGSPLMTVTGYDQSLAEKGAYVEVTWFDASRVEHNIFLEDTLRASRSPVTGVQPAPEQS
jgi:uncharacterized protein YodC (DUF2158 family)